VLAARRVETAGERCFKIDNSESARGREREFTVYCGISPSLNGLVRWVKLSGHWLGAHGHGRRSACIIRR